MFLNFICYNVYSKLYLFVFFSQKLYNTLLVVETTAKTNNRAWWHKSIYTKVWSKNQLGLYQFIQKDMTIYFMGLDNMVTDGFGKLENNWCMFKQLIVPITHTVWSINYSFPVFGAKILNSTNPLTMLVPQDFCPFVQQTWMIGTCLATARGHNAI